MSHQRNFRFLSAFILVLLMLGEWIVREADAETTAIIKTEYQYAVKITCSMLGTFGDGFLTEGVYRTVINVHNPSDKKVEFVRKVALAGQVDEPPSEFSVTPFKKATLGPDGAIQVDCFAISNFFCPIDGICVDFTAIDGFLVINSPVELDVVAVYTARPPDGKVATMDVENVQGRKVIKTIKVVIPETKPEIKKRIKYPPPT